MTFSLNPTYYQVTWTANSPTNYTGLTGNSNGGLDPVTAWGTNRLISVTGTAAVAGTPMADGETIVINDYVISFLSTDNLASIISKINLATKFTGVAADQSVAGTYITLMNAPGKEGYPFSLAEGNGSALSKLKLTAGTYSYYPSEVGTAFTSVTTDSNITINGVNIVFVAGGISSAASQINANTEYTGVSASVAGPYLQMSSITGQTWTINSGNAYTNLGTTIGNHGGYPTTLAYSQAKERANMRWTQMIAELEENSTPILLGNIVRTGNISNIETSSVTFTVGYDRPDTVYTVARPEEPDAGNLLVGASAVKRAVARALTAVITGNRKVFDPTIQSYGAYCDRPNAARIQQITATGLDTVSNVTIVENNLTVTQIAGV
jgi:hypothetical protein